MNKKLAKMAVTESANQDLTAMLEEVNKNFTQGKVTKTKLLSWIISDFYKSYFQKSISKIQKESVDSVSQLTDLLKKAKIAKKQGQQIDIHKYISKHKV